MYFGTPAFAVPPLEALLVSRHQVVALVSQPDRPRGRGQQLHPTPTREVAETHGIPVLQPARIKDPAFLQAVRAFAPDLGVVAAYGRILPDDLLAIPRLGMINVHASVLPRYRGAAPIQRAVLAGDDETGVTIMQVVSELDAGPMLAAAKVPIPPDATSGEIESAVARVGAPLLIQVVDDMSLGRVPARKQDAAGVTFAPKVTKDEGPIDWSRPAKIVHDKVRGLQPWPLASTHLGGRRYVIRRTVVEATTTGEPYGTIIEAHGEVLAVAAGNGTVVRILEIQPEGRRSMTAREFLAGHHPAVGDRFDP